MPELDSTSLSKPRYRKVTSPSSATAVEKYWIFPTASLFAMYVILKVSGEAETTKEDEVDIVVREKDKSNF